MGTKKRFGLFSHPISTAIGDDSPFRSKERTINHMQIHEIRWESQLLNLEISTPHLSSRASSTNLISLLYIHLQHIASTIISFKKAVVC